jgi:hypothetical protein
MTYTVEKLTVQTSTQERQLITIEFAPQIDSNETEYSYPQPQFVFGEQVVPKNNLSITLIICGMELVVSKTSSGQLLNQPYWKYKLDDGQQNLWLNESALTAEGGHSQALPCKGRERVTRLSTCSQCTYFNDFNDPQGRGWCNLFGTTARQHHLRTNDCDLYQDSEPLNTPHPSFALDSIVKIIDPDEHHSEWATFTVIARKYNTKLYRSTEAYLSEPDWFYQLVPLSYKKTIEPLWVKENDICDFDQSHLICTQDIF